jgi:hypothetical protein
MAVTENFDDNIELEKKFNLKGGNPENANVKSIPGKENLNAQKPIENNSINSINGNNASLPQNQRTESITETLDQLPSITNILKGKKDVLPPPVTKKYKD